MEKACQKIDDLRPGVQDLDEALRNFGLQTQGQLQITADKFAASWQQISNSTAVLLADLRKAFDQYAAAQTAANKGLEPSAVSLDRTILQTKEAAAGAGKGVEDGMRRAGDAIDSATGKVNRFNEALHATTQDAGNASGDFNDRVTKAGQDSQKRTNDVNSVAADNSGADDCSTARRRRVAAKSPRQTKTRSSKPSRRHRRTSGSIS